MTHFKLNQQVKIKPSNDNEGYDSFRHKTLIITHIAANKDEHPGYDESVSPEYLYDLKTLDGEEIGSSLYDYELVSA